MNDDDHIYSMCEYINACIPTRKNGILFLLSLSLTSSPLCKMFQEDTNLILLICIHYKFENEKMEDGKVNANMNDSRDLRRRRWYDRYKKSVVEAEHKLEMMLLKTNKKVGLPCQATCIYITCTYKVLKHILCMVRHPRKMIVDLSFMMTMTTVQ